MTNLNRKLKGVEQQIQIHFYGTLFACVFGQFQSVFARNLNMRICEEGKWQSASSNE